MEQEQRQQQPLPQLGGKQTALTLLHSSAVVFPPGKWMYITGYNTTDRRCKCYIMNCAFRAKTKERARGAIYQYLVLGLLVVYMDSVHIMCIA